jgi:hypothetical protein
MDRSQTVVVNGKESSARPVSSGVPQGTVLGPLLFLIYINNITDHIKSSLRLFADDSVLYRPITSMEDHETIQNDLRTLQKWADDWKMKFNVSKCAVMTITKKKKPSLCNYTMKNETIPRVDEHDYLGIRIADDLSWNKHCNNIINKSSKTLGLIRRNLHSCNTEVYSLAYRTLVRPKLEYASTAWSPHTTSYINKLEAIQNSAARFCTRNYQRSQSVTELKRQLNWDTLYTRRAMNDATMFYKICHGHVRITFPSTVIPPPVMLTRRNHSHTKWVPPASINAYKYSFFVRTIPLWNKLPASAAEATSIEAFQTAARNYISSLP